MLHHAGARPRTPGLGRRARVALAAGACVALATACGGTRSQAAASPTSGGLSVIYEAPARGGAAERDFLRDRRPAEKVAEDVGGAFRLPKPITIAGRSCEKGDVPEYDPETRRIALCYSYVAEVRAMFESAHDPDPAGRTAGVITETLYHEVAHALVDTLKLAPTGREEDVADQFAAYRLIPRGPEGRKAVLAAADNYAQYARESRPEDVELGAEHPPDATRAANYRCYLYGAARAEFSDGDAASDDDLIDGEVLTKERASVCEEEYGGLRRGWDGLLAPYRRG
ncbi:DUF4344 domain-containing metallopeptidase [Streptomyces eurocidicus]|uniref:Uncharacterized protein n=1 Tax=Streptomyces eurocidicus TaxID=66423 RepID=A0A7W8F2H0_STREU|nr:DUF4344 domain-containing metallopeptidase [Streptomyces eurocidicus]MBB5119522.1 hypothetical protein [Streptomyces eurocidicus]MBF6050560.1 hypothetical protein [Streptomyces eurocidicus]